MVTNTSHNDPLARLKEARSQAQSSTNSKFFFLKDGEKAVVRILRNMDEIVAMGTHRRWNEATRRFDVHSICAREFQKECAYCLEARTDKKLADRDMFYLPIYVHKKRGTDGQEREIAMMLYLEMPPTDGILVNLEQIFYGEGDETHDITDSDYVISRIGSGSTTKYSVQPRRNSAPLPLPHDITFPDRETIRSDVEMAHPMKAVESEEEEQEEEEHEPLTPDW